MRNPVLALCVLALGACDFLGPDVATKTRQCDNGRSQSCVDMAAAFVAGHGVSVDYAMAARMFRKGAQLGHPIAQLNMGSVLSAGIGMPADPETAYMWYTLAINQGNEKARIERESVRPRLSQQQIASALARAETFRPRTP